MTQRVPDTSAKQTTQLPIDIDYSKFLTWLIDRRRIPRNWHTQLKASRILARTAHAQTSPSVRERLCLPVQLGPHDSIDYHTVRSALDGLLSGDPSVAETDMLGRYKDPVVRSWYEASSAYEKNDIFLADAAQLLVRNADIEAPAIQQRIARLTADGADAARREGAVTRAAADARTRYVATCQRYNIDPGVDSPDFHRLLAQFVAQKVLVVLQDAFHAAVDAGNALQYYEDFAAQIAQNDISLPCSTLRTIINSDVGAVVRTSHTASRLGNQTLNPSMNRNWNIATPGVNEKTTSPDIEGKDNGNNDGIDWDIDVTSSGTDALNVISNEAHSDIISLDIQAEPTSNQAANSKSGDQDDCINWNFEVGDTGTEKTGLTSDVSNINSEADGGINWNIEIADTGNVRAEHELADEVLDRNKADGGINWGIELGETGTDNYTAKKSDVQNDAEESLTLMDMQTRAAFLDDVGELYAFLTRRVLELGRTSSGVGVWAEVMTAMSDNIRRVSEDDARAMVHTVQAVRESLTSPDARHILALHSNPRVFDRTARECMQLLAAANKAHAAIGALHEKRARIATDLAAEMPKMEELSKKTRAVISSTEVALSKLYNGRTVNILGEINNVFPPDDR